MALTKAQKHLIAGLNIFGVEKDAIVGIVLTLERPEQQDALMEWMCQHRGATTAEILRQTALLAKQPELDDETTQAQTQDIP